MQTDPQLRWRKRCGTGACVEVAPTLATTFVRDSKAPEDARLAVSAPAWSSFVTAVTSGGISTDRH